MKYLLVAPIILLFSLLSACRQDGKPISSVSSPSQQKQAEALLVHAGTEQQTFKDR